MSTDRTFAFVDLAGFTAATEVHGDLIAVELAERLVEVATAALGPGDRLVKSIGDAVMLASDDPVDAVRAVGAICSSLDEEQAFPVLRAGLHAGSALERDGDWFGGAVNLAARVAARAAGDQVLHDCRGRGGRGGWLRDASAGRRAAPQRARARLALRGRGLPDPT